MSREIKFRAWDKINNKMSIVYFINWFCNKCGIKIHGKKRSVSLDTVDLMQYTGLKDKNDKEIYEGDIVNIINNLLDEEDGYFIVKYDIETARYILSGNSLVYDFDNIYANECEVIDNIYKNPELLKEV